MLEEVFGMTESARTPETVPERLTTAMKGAKERERERVNETGFRVQWQEMKTERERERQSER